MNEADKKLLYERLKQSTGAFENPELENSLTLARQIIAPATDTKSKVEQYADKLDTKTVEEKAKIEDEKNKNKVYSKETGKLVTKDYDGDGDIDQYDAEIQAAEERKEAEEIRAAIAATASVAVGYAATSTIETNLFSSTMRTNVEYANKSIGNRTEQLYKTLVEAGKEDGKEPPEKVARDAKIITEKTGDVLKDAYEKLLTTFDKAINGTKEEDFKEFDKFIDGLDAKEYNLKPSEKERIKEIWRGLTPEERTKLFEKSFKGWEADGIEVAGVDEKEAEFIANAPKVIEDIQKRLNTNDIEKTATCFASNCKLVADVTVRGNFVHAFDDLMKEKKLIPLVKEVAARTSYNQEQNTVITNPEAIKQNPAEAYLNSIGLTPIKIEPVKVELPKEIAAITKQENDISAEHHAKTPSKKDLKINAENNDVKIDAHKEIKPTEKPAEVKPVVETVKTQAAEPVKTADIPQTKIETEISKTDVQKLFEKYAGVDKKMDKGEYEKFKAGLFVADHITEADKKGGSYGNNKTNTVGDGNGKITFDEVNNFADYAYNSNGKGLYIPKEFTKDAVKDYGSYYAVDEKNKLYDKQNVEITLDKANKMKGDYTTLAKALEGSDVTKNLSNHDITFAELNLGNNANLAVNSTGSKQKE